MKWIIIVGNVCDGCSFFGPFDTSELAIAYAEENCDSGWLVGALHPAEEL